MTTTRMKARLLGITAALVLLSAIPALGKNRKHQPIIPTLPPTPTLAPSTVPPNGDVNPYGVAFVPHNYQGGGPLKGGDIVVSNFNNSGNVQGTGTTIVRVTPDANVSVFFQGQSGLGLNTALGVLRRGFVLVGNLPTTDGSCNTIGQTSLLIIDHNGSQVASLSDPNLLNGPWDLVIHDQGEIAQVFVSNVLSGTVTRINMKINRHGNPVIKSMTQIASGYGHACNAAAVVVGPTGLAYDATKDILYVASTDDNEIFAVPNARKTMNDAGTGTLVYQDNTHLHGPLGLVLDLNGDLITANGDAINGDPSQPSELVEFTTSGQFVGQFSVDPSQGAAFGLALDSSGNRVTFAAVDDATNVLDIWDLGDNE
jgi:sugar lactone lactonase YvrE